jgi:hypothetical protein
MDVKIMAGSPSAADETRSLRAWLLDESEFHGRVTILGTPPRRGEMGTDVIVLLVALLTADAVRLLGSLIITWMSARANPVKVTVQLADGRKVTIDAQVVRKLSPTRLHGG